MMRMKRIFKFAVILVLVCLLCGCRQTEEKLTPTENFYVNDFADVISDDAESEMFSKAVALNQKTTAQVVVITVLSLDGEEISDYALQLGREWGVGDKEKNNGVVILLSTEDREIDIEVGYGLEGALTDSKTGRIIDYYGLEYLKQDDFSNGLLNISNALINEVYIEYGIDAENGYVPVEQLPQTQGEAGKVASSWVALIVFLIIFFLIFGRGGGALLFLGGPRFRGGGFGGGFGGFSGGGGSFGGGGAGRRF